MTNYIGQLGYTIYKNNLSQTELYHLRNELNVKPYSSHSTNASEYPVYRESNNKIYVPRYYGLDNYGSLSVNKLYIGDKISLTFKGDLYDYQLKIINKYITFVGKSGGGLLDVEPGKGKTVMALKIISILQKKTLVIVHKGFLMRQWIDRINQFLPGTRVGTIQGDVLDIDNKDIVLGMLQTVSTKKYDRSLWSQFGLTVFDECHHLSAEVFSKVMINNVCNYNLGLSGTMTRKDGLTKVFKWFIGPVIHKEASDLTINVNVKVIEYENDELFQNIPTDFRGNILYSTLISRISECYDRTELLIKIIQNELKLNSNQQIMILAHNRDLTKRLYEGIIKYEDSVGFYLGGMKEKNLKESESKKIIIATYSMASEGLDIKTLTTLLMATPKSDVRQSVGRILRSKHATPTVIDVVDNYSIFKNQYRKRLVYYNNKKYTINYHNSFRNYIDLKPTIQLKKECIINL